MFYSCVKVYQCWGYKDKPMERIRLRFIVAQKYVGEIVDFLWRWMMTCLLGSGE